MEESIRSRLKHAWNVFRSKEATSAQPFQNDPWTGYHTYHVGIGSTGRLDRVRFTPSTEKSFVAALYNRIAIDVAAIPIKHIRTDKDGRYKSTIESGLNNCLGVEANLDQTGRELIQDVVISMCDEGVAALVPVDTNVTLKEANAFDILTLRVGKILEWYPKNIKVRVYYEETGEPQEVVLPKDKVAIIQNPFFATMNEPNSTLKRLINKLNLLDMLDEQNSSNRFNMILQLPYTVKSEARKKQAAERLEDLEKQLADSQYGIAYIDGTEKITQLNRTIESDLLKQIEELKNDLYSQMGISKEVFDGTADEQKTLNYENGTLEPILSTICDEMIRKFLTKTARTQGQTIKYFKDPFRLIPINNIADIADKFTRNEILSSNELRSIIGREPVDDPRADELRNKNLNQSNEELQEEADWEYVEEDDTDVALSELDAFDDELDALEAELAQSDMAGGIAHYASPYYDPVKAHEYYEKHKKLKGRTSTAKLNDNGKAAASYIKDRLTDERKAKVEEHKTTTNNSVERNNEKKKSDTQRFNAQMKTSINRLKNQLKSMSAEDKALNSDQIMSQIERLREENQAQREALTESTKSSNKNLRDTHTQYKKDLKDEYDEKYISELERLRKDKSMTK